MRKQFLLIASAMLCGASAFAQVDVTSTYVVNPGFEDCTAFAAGQNAAATGSAAGTDYTSAGWTLNGQASWSNSAVMAYGSGSQINGVAIPSTDSEGNTTGQALGISVGWGAQLYYKSADQVTLPAGTYKLQADFINVLSGVTQFNVILGFGSDQSTDENVAYNTWSTKSVTFTLSEETAGQFWIGGGAISGGSGSNAKVFIDNIKLFFYAADKSELENVVAEATSINGYLQNGTLSDAIAAAQSVVDDTSASQNAVDEAVTTLQSAVETAKQNMAAGTEATFFITNNSFETGDFTGWTYYNANDTRIAPNTNATYTTSGIDGDYLFNTWGGTAAKYVKQTLTGLPEGYYNVSALIASDANLSITLYAGSASVEVASSQDGKGVFVTGTTPKVYVSDGTLEIGTTSTNWYKADNFRLFYQGTTLSPEEVQALLDEVPTGKMNSDVQTDLDAAVVAVQTEATSVNVSALQTAIAAANVSIAAYQHANAALEGMNALMTSTAAITTDASLSFEQTISVNQEAYDEGSLTDEQANALVDPYSVTGWHSAADADYGEFLISAWDSEDDSWDGLHVNTWSAAADFGNTGFAVPLLEYWVGSGSLPAKTMTATIDGYAANTNYKVTGEFFINGSSTPAGFSLQVGDAASTAITGTSDGSGHFSGETSAYGQSDENGNIVVKVIVDGANSNWIAFRNFTIEEVAVDYSALNAAIAEATALDSEVASGVTVLEEGIAAAQELLSSTDQDAVDDGVTALQEAIQTASSIITQKKALIGGVKRAVALESFLPEESNVVDYVNQANELIDAPDATASDIYDMFMSIYNEFMNYMEDMSILNGTFDENINIAADGTNSGEMNEMATEAKPYIWNVEGWTANFTFNATASQGTTAVYGAASSATNGTNGTNAPAVDMYGLSDGGTLHLSSGWGDQARYYQEMLLPAGKYVFYYEGYNANNVNTSLNSNYFGLSNVPAGAIEGTNNTFIFSDEKNFTYGEWKPVAFGFTLNQDVFVRVNVGVIGGTAGSGNTPKMWFDNVGIYRVGDADIVLDEAATPAVNDAFNVNVTLNRSLNADQWNSLVLPFDLTNAQLVECFGEDAIVAEFAEGMTVDDEPIVEFSTMENPAITANVPVLIKLSDSFAGNEFYFTGVSMSACEGNPVIEGDDFNFVGVYDVENNIQPGDYFFSGASYYKATEATRPMKAFRAFIRVKNGAELKGISIDGKTVEDATAINGLQIEKASDGAIYNLQGQRVNKAEKGIYIQNGKKILVK